MLFMEAVTDAGSQEGKLGTAHTWMLNQIEVYDKQRNKRHHLHFVRSGSPLYWLKEDSGQK